MYFKRKAYDKLLEWKKLYSEKYAVLLEGARRFFHSNNLSYAFLLKYIITSTNISMLYHKIYIPSMNIDPIF